MTNVAKQMCDIIIVTVLLLRNCQVVVTGSPDSGGLHFSQGIKTNL